MYRDSRKSRQKMAKNTADFCENRKNHGKDMASSHGPKDHYTVYKSQHLALTTIITCSARCFLLNFVTGALQKYVLDKIHISTMTSWWYIEPVSNKTKTDW